MRERLLHVLKEVRADIDFENTERMIDDGILDSFDIIQVVMGMNEEFDIEIQVEDLQPDNFNTFKAMLELITNLQEE